jgi:hypothetical protein
MPFFAPAYGVIARILRFVGIPSVAIVHNALPHERHVGDTWLSRFFLRACVGHVVMSDAVAEDLRLLRAPDADVHRIEHPVYERFGDSVPMDEALVHVALDLGGRAHVESDLADVSPMTDHVARSLAQNAEATLHVRVLREGMRHHVAEAAAKALGLSLRDAMQPSADVESTKGTVEWEDEA